MRRSIRSILLLPGLTILAAVIYAVATLFEFLIAYVTGVSRDVLFAHSTLGLSVLCVAAGVYGLGRVVAYHPFYSARYRQWMESVPWQPGMPLPLGPVMLNWRDAVVLVPAALLAEYVSGGSAVLPLLAFGATHLLALAVTEGGA